MTKNRPRRTRKTLKFKDAKRLDTIHDLMDDEAWEEAYEKLENFTYANPDVLEGWDMMMQLAAAEGNRFLAWEATQNSLELEPDEAMHYYNVALISAQLSMPFSALHYSEIYVQRFPTGLHFKRCHELHGVALAECNRIREEDPMVKSAGLADLMLFEQGQLQVSMGNPAEGRKLSLQAAQKLPDFPAPMNNVSLSYAMEGKLEQALQTTEQVLARHPDNIHARCNRAQFLVRLGRAAEAQPTLEGLRVAEPDLPDYWVKIIEAFAYAGDDAGVLEAYQRSKEVLNKVTVTQAPLGLHFAAVAYARQGNQREAEKLWKAALERMPGLDLAQENLADLRRPVGQRNGAWYHAFNYWIIQDWAKQLAMVMGRNVRRSPQALERDLERLFQKIPGLKAVFSIALDRGDETGREFVLQVATSFPVEGLKEFTFGQRGTDDMRMRAARLLANRGEIDASQPVELYISGKPEPILMLSYEIYGETEPSSLPEDAHAYLQDGFDALHDREPREALEYIEAGLRLVPDERTFLNQKAAALTMLKRTKEAETVIRHTAALYPDYLFARCSMAQLCAREGKLDEATEWLQPLLTRSRFHRSEFRALAYAQIEILKARGEKGGIASWRAMLNEIGLED